MRPRLAGRVLMAVGAFGVVASLAAGAVGSALVAGVDETLRSSLALTDDALEALDASVAVADETVVVVRDGLAGLEETARGLEPSLTRGGTLMSDAADLTGTSVADSLDAVNASLPALTRVAGAIDRTLTAVGQLPFTQGYAPEQPLDTSVRDLETNLAGVPDRLREQAQLLAGAGDDLSAAGGDVTAIADDLAALRTSMEDAEGLLTGYATTAGDARALLADSAADLGRRAALARVAVWALALTVAAGQVVPLWLGRELAAGRILVTASGDRAPLGDDFAR